jgi:hypothetical protein
MGIHGLKLVLTYEVINAWDYLQCGRATSRAPPIAIDVWHLEVGQGLDAGHNGTRGGCSLVPYTASRLAASPTDTAIRALVSPHRLGAVRAGLGLRCVGGLGGLAAAALSQPVRAWPSLCGGGGRRKLLPE